MMTLPPRPPLPPLGPPNSTNFSRRKETAPAPPLPERTNTLVWSRNFTLMFFHFCAPAPETSASHAKAILVARSNRKSLQLFLTTLTHGSPPTLPVSVRCRYGAPPHRAQGKGARRGRS